MVANDFTLHRHIFTKWRLGSVVLSIVTRRGIIPGRQNIDGVEWFLIGGSCQSPFSEHRVRLRGYRAERAVVRRMIRCGLLTGLIHKGVPVNPPLLNPRL